jgi:hypothetical protein
MALKRQVCLVSGSYPLRTSKMKVEITLTGAGVAGRLGDRGSIPGRGKRIFTLVSVSRPALGLTQPPVQWVPGVLSPGLKRGDADHLPPFSAEVVNEQELKYSPLCSSICLLWDFVTFFI